MTPRPTSSSGRKTARPRRGSRADRRPRESATPRSPLRTGQKPARRRVPYGCFPLLEVKGKVIDSVEVWTHSDFHAVVINFNDRTCLIVEAEADIVMNADYMSGEEDRRIKKWPPMDTARFKI